MEALRIEKLTKTYGGIMALREVSFSVSEGERLAIIGPNGAGKTTLFNLINGQIPVTSGKIFLFGREITYLPAHQRVQLGISRSFQIISLFQNLTVIENALLTFHGKNPWKFQMLRSCKSFPDIISKAAEALKIANLWEKRHDRVSLLSYGEQRRLEIILSILSGPRILLLDEPSNGLTSEESKAVIEMIYKMGKGVTVIIVAHDMDLVFEIAEKIMVLHYGELLASGHPEEIRNNPKVREIYMGIEERGHDA